MIKLRLRKLQRVWRKSALKLARRYVFRLRYSKFLFYSYIFLCIFFDVESNALYEGT
jgi:hypothetical protein